MTKAKVYFTKEITPQSLIAIYKALGVELSGKVGVKISTGEPGGPRPWRSAPLSGSWTAGAPRRLPPLRRRRGERCC